MRAQLVFLFALTVIVSGCGTVATLQPLYSEETITFDEKLLGVWAEDPNDPEDNLRVERLDDDEKVYKLTFTEDNHKGIFELRLVKLQENLYFDIVPATWPSGEKDVEDAPYGYNGFHFVRLHSFGRIDSVDPVLTIRLSSEDDMEELLEAEPDILAHTFAEEDRLLIIAPSKQLQAFVLKYRDNEKVFAEPTKFYRVKIGATGELDCSTEKGQDSGG